MKMLLTGGSGLLGQQLIPILRKTYEVVAPTHEYLDITKVDTVREGIDWVIHAAAYTDVEGAQTNRVDCYNTNVIGTFNMVKLYHNVPFVYISSEYANKPTNFYAYTKRVGEMTVRSLHDHFLIIRTLFKPNPFPHENAFIDQFTMGDYVDMIAKLIMHKVDRWLEEATSQTCYIGTGRKTMYELAKKTRPDVGQISVKDIKGVKIPTDYK